MHETKANIAKALVACQAELKNPTFDRLNTAFGKGSKYASLASHVDAVKPVLAKHGLTVAFLVGGANGSLTLSTLLVHTSGEILSSDLTVTMPSDPQKTLALLTYLRRGSLSAILNVAAEDDDDGNSVGGVAAAPAPVARREPTDDQLRQQVEAIRARHGIEKALAGGEKKREPKDLEEVRGIVAEVEEREGAKGPYWWIRLEDGPKLTAWSASNSMVSPGRAYVFRCTVKPSTNPKYGPSYSIHDFAETGEEIPF